MCANGLARDLFEIEGYFDIDLQIIHQYHLGTLTDPNDTGNRASDDILSVCVPIIAKLLRDLLGRIQDHVLDVLDRTRYLIAESLNVVLDAHDRSANVTSSVAVGIPARRERLSAIAAGVCTLGCSMLTHRNAANVTAVISVRVVANADRGVAPITDVILMIAVGMVAHASAATVADVILILVLARAVELGTAVVALVIVVLVLTGAVGLAASVVALVIVVLVLTGAVRLAASVVALVIVVLVLASAVGFVATAVAFVIVVLVLTGAVGFAATVVADVVFVSVCTSAVGFVATVVAFVIVVLVLASAVGFVATVVAFVIVVLVLTGAVGLAATVITGMVFVSVCASAAGLIAAVVALVVFVSVCASAIRLGATIVAFVIVVLVLTGAVGFVATVVADVVFVSVCTSAVGFVATVVAFVIVVLVLASAAGLITTVVADVVLVTVCTGVSSFSRNRYLCISGRGNDTRLVGFIIMIARGMCPTVICAITALAPNVVRTCRGEGDFGITLIIGHNRTKCFAVNRTVKNFKIGSILYPRLTEHQIAEGMLQLHGKSFACFHGIIVYVIAVLVCKQVKASKLIPKELITFKACNVEEIARLQNDAVGGCANRHKITGLRFIYGEITVKEVHEIFCKAKDTALEIGAAGESIEGNLAPITTIKLLVSVNKQLKSGGFVIAVTVCVIEHILQAVFGKVNGGNIRKSYGNIHHRRTVFVFDVMLVEADGEIHVLAIACIRGSIRKCHDGEQTDNQHDCDQHGEHFCRHSFCVVFHNTNPFFFERIAHIFGVAICNRGTHAPVPRMCFDLYGKVSDL